MTISDKKLKRLAKEIIELFSKEYLREELPSVYMQCKPNATYKIFKYKGYKCEVKMTAILYIIDIENNIVEIPHERARNILANYIKKLEKKQNERFNT